MVNQGFHPGFTRKVHAAIDQVRDYEEAMRNPANFEAIRKRLGFYRRARVLRFSSAEIRIMEPTGERFKVARVKSMLKL